VRTNNALSRRIRVLLVAPSLDILGGQAVQASRIREQIAQTPDIEMRFQPINPRVVAPFQFLLRIKGLRTLTNFASYFPALVWRAWPVDILHIFTAAYTSYLLWSMPALLIGKLLGKKVILNYRDGQGEDHLKNWRTAIPTIRLADRIVAPSGFIVDVFRKFGLSAISIFNFIDTAHFIDRRRRQLRPVFMTNRILEPLYNIHCLLRAFQRIQQRYPDATLTLAHDGPSRQELEAFAGELGLRHTSFIGRVPHTQIRELYDAADIYLTTPNIDCMPGSLLECFASGLPIIATKAGGIPYVVTDEKDGLLVELDDDEGVARASFRLLEDPVLVERLTDAGREAVKSYAPERVRQQWAALYRELVGRR